MKKTGVKTVRTVVIILLLLAIAVALVFALTGNEEKAPEVQSSQDDTLQPLPFKKCLNHYGLRHFLFAFFA